MDCTKVLAEGTPGLAKDVYWGSTEFSEESLNLVENGVMKFTIAPRPYAIGQLSLIQLAQQIPRPKTLEIINAGMDWIAEDNVEAFKHQYFAAPDPAQSKADKGQSLP